MRITNRITTQTLLNNISSNLQKMDKYQRQISSGKIISRPSDNPIATSLLINAKSALKAQEQYTHNMEDAVGWLDAADVALSRSNEVLQEARELAVAGSTGTTDTGSMSSLAYAVDGLIGEMVQIANTSYAGKYIFGGGKSSTAPFVANKQDDGKIATVEFKYNEELLSQIYTQEISVDTGVTIDISCGQITFHTSSDGSSQVNAVFNKLIELRENLDSGNQDSVGALIKDLDKLLDNVLSERAVVGSKASRMELALKRASAYELNMTTLISKLEDADYAMVSISYSTQWAVYKSSLAAGARVIQPSLLDFLR